MTDQENNQRDYAAELDMGDQERQRLACFFEGASTDTAGDAKR